MSDIATPRLIKPSEAAMYLSISQRKLWDLSKSKVLPAVRIGRAVRYDISDLDNFIHTCKGESDESSL